MSIWFLDNHWPRISVVVTYLFLFSSLFFCYFFRSLRSWFLFCLLSLFLLFFAILFRVRFEFGFFLVGYGFLSLLPSYFFLKKLTLNTPNRDRINLWPWLIFTWEFNLRGSFFYPYSSLLRAFSLYRTYSGQAYFSLSTAPCLTLYRNAILAIRLCCLAISVKWGPPLLRVILIIWGFSLLRFLDAAEIRSSGSLLNIN